MLGAVVAWLLIREQALVGDAAARRSARSVAYILYRAVFTLPKRDRDRIFAALYLIALARSFWALFEQAGSSLNLFTDRSVDRTCSGWEIPASMFQSVNSVWIITLAPVFARLWTWLGRRGLEPSAPFKFGLGMIQIGARLPGAGRGRGHGGAMTPVIFIILIYLLHTIARTVLLACRAVGMTRLSAGRWPG